MGWGSLDPRFSGEGSVLMELVLASGNRHKIGELHDLLRPLGGWEVFGPERIGGMPPVEESAPDFFGNARLKAEALRASAGARAVLSDDSGLCVEALGGAPGVYSSRFAGPGADDKQNIAKLLQSLSAATGQGRRAHFCCVLCLWLPDEDAPCFFEGSVHGTIAADPRGSMGFGYDPVFVPDGYDQTFGELGAVVKKRISHRARALEKLKDGLQRLG